MLMSLSKFFTITIITIASILFSVQNVFGQVKSDSLRNIWNDPNQNDTIRLQAIDDLAWNYYVRSQIDSALYYGQLEYKFAERLGDSGKMIAALITQGNSVEVRGNYKKAIEFFTQSLKISQESHNKSGMSASINNLGNIYKSVGD